MKSMYGVFAALSLLIAFVFNPFGAGMFALPKFVFLAIFVSAVFMGIASFCFVKGEIKIRYHSVVYGILLLWLLSLVLSTVFSIAPLTSFWGEYERMQGLYAHLLYISVFLIFLHFLAEKTARDVFLKILVAVASLVAIHAVLQKFGIALLAPFEMVEFLLGRSFATFGQPNFLGQFLLFPLWIALYFFLCKKCGWKIKSVYGAAFLLIFIALFLTENRSSILGFAVGALFFLFFTKHIKTKFKYILGSGLLVGIAFIIFLFMPSLRSAGSRFHLWQAAFDIFPQFPLIGSGLETFKFTYQKVATPSLFNFENLFAIPDRVHNIFLDTLVQQGLFGLLVYSGILIGIFILFFKNYKTKNSLLLFCFCSFISILVGEFFGFSLAPHYVLTTALIAIILNICVDFRIFKLRNKYLIGALIVFLFGFSLFNINHATSVLYADMSAFRGYGLAKKGDLVKGSELLEEAVETNKRQSKIFFDYSEVVLHSGDEDAIRESKKALEAAGRFDGHSFIYHLYKGDFYTKTGAFIRAEESFEKARELAPSSPIVFREFGSMYFSKGDYKSAIDKFEEFLDTMPDIPSFKKREHLHVYDKHFLGFEVFFNILYESSLNIGDSERAKFYKQFL